MQVRELAVPGAYELVPRRHGDDRGEFMEWFKAELMASLLGYTPAVAQANCSVSRRGVLRGIHFSDVPPGQAKLVTCFTGAVLDVAVDLRVGSPTFGAWDAVRLDPVDRRCIYLAEGLGHAFLALQEDTTVAYLVSTGYAPGREHGVHPLDPDLAIDWPLEEVGGTAVLSDKDAVAPSLADAVASGLLPDNEACAEYLAHLAQLART